MRKPKKNELALFLSFVLFVFSFIVPVKAVGPEKSLYYNNATMVASISSGTLSITDSYRVASGKGFTGANIHTFVERKVLGIFWVKVNNGQANNTWIDTSSALLYSKTYSLVLPQTGTYRVTARQQTVTY